MNFSSEKTGLSMAELAVAVTVIALAVGPLIGLLSNSNQLSKHSIYEEMSVHHCREIIDQLLRFNDKIPLIVESAQKLTGNKNLTFADLLNDENFNLELNKDISNSAFIPFQRLGRKTDFRIFISKMDKVFKTRTISAYQLESDGNTHFKDKNYLKIIVKVTWKSSENDPLKKTEMAIITGEY